LLKDLESLFFFKEVDVTFHL